MRRAAWIAIDLAFEALGRRAVIGMALFLGLWLPFQSGLLDGLAPLRGGIWKGLGFRYTLTMNAAWPALAILGPLAEILIGRRQTRRMEPLLALPITLRELTLGAALPAIATGCVSPLTTLGMNAIAYRLAAGAWPDGLVSDLGFLCLATQTATLWLSLFMILAALTSPHVSSFTVRASIGYMALLLLDAPLVAARATGIAWLVPWILLAEAGAGACLLLLADGWLDRERIAGL